MGTATCIGTGGPCESALATCDGTMIVQCVGLQEARTECSAQLVDGICVATETGASCAIGSECDPAQTPDTCEGDTLTFCAGGVLQTAQCSDFGFQPCLDGRCQAYAR
jgi:hypothetical protein